MVFRRITSEEALQVICADIGGVIDTNSIRSIYGNHSLDLRGEKKIGCCGNGPAGFDGWISSGDEFSTEALGFEVVHYIFRSEGS